MGHTWMKGRSGLSEKLKVWSRHVAARPTGGRGAWDESPPPVLPWPSHLGTLVAVHAPCTLSTHPLCSSKPRTAVMHPHSEALTGDPRAHHRSWWDFWNTVSPHGTESPLPESPTLEPWSATDVRRKVPWGPCAAVLVMRGSRLRAHSSPLQSPRLWPPLFWAPHPSRHPHASLPLPVTWRPRPAARSGHHIRHCWLETGKESSLTSGPWFSLDARDNWGPVAAWNFAWSPNHCS